MKNFIVKRNGKISNKEYFTSEMKSDTNELSSFCVNFYEETVKSVKLGGNWDSNNMSLLIFKFFKLK